MMVSGEPELVRRRGGESLLHQIVVARWYGLEALAAFLENTDQIPWTGSDAFIRGFIGNEPIAKRRICD